MLRVVKKERGHILLAPEPEGEPQIFLNLSPVGQDRTAGILFLEAMGHDFLEQDEQMRRTAPDAGDFLEIRDRSAQNAVYGTECGKEFFCDGFKVAPRQDIGQQQFDDFMVGQGRKAVLLEALPQTLAVAAVGIFHFHTDRSPASEPTPRENPEPFAAAAVYPGIARSDGLPDVFSAPRDTSKLFPGD